MRVTGGILTALGGAGLAVGGVMGLITMNTVGDLTACNDNPACKSAEQSAFYDKAVNQQTGAFVALGIGGGLALTGIVLLAVSSEPAVSSDPERSAPGNTRTSFFLSPTGGRLLVAW